MALIDLWHADRSQITEKRIQQLIAFAGEGKLRDANNTSHELRDLLSVAPSELIGSWIDECLVDRFSDFGFILQDIINEIGRRLGFDVKSGVYRGRSGEGYDGLWRVPGAGAILVESKSSTAYSVNLATIAAYRKQVNVELGVSPEDISILLVVGRDATNDLEAQVRGSRFAWDIRLLGVDSLFRLLKLKETLDDPSVERQIQEILVPREFTRLDRIVDLVFDAAEDAQLSMEQEPADDIESGADEQQIPPVRFHERLLPKLESYFSRSLIRRARVLWSTPDGDVLLSCQVSKKHDRGGADFWFGLKRSTQLRLQEHDNAYCVFGLGDAENVLLIPYRELEQMLSHCSISRDADGRIIHWHVRFLEADRRIRLIQSGNSGNADVTNHLLVTGKSIAVV